MDDYTLSMAEAINEHQGNADADHSVNVSMAEAINEYQDRFSADTEGVTEHQATIPADTNHSPGAKIVFASADEPWLDEMAHPFSSADAIATPSHRAADANICPICPMSHRWDKWDKWDKWDNRRPTGYGRYLERKQSDKPKSIEIH